VQEKELLKQALDGDINAFQRLFAEFQDQLKSYLYRLLANRNDAEDITHDAFIRAFDKRNQFRGESSFKTWVFQIATNLARNLLAKRKRWPTDVSAQAKELVMSTPDLAGSLEQVATNSPYGKYEIKEHIDTCFTCISKSLPIEQQVVLMLKDIYDFSIKEIMLILDRTEGQAKYFLQTARKTMVEIFDRRCALVSKKGTCHQCSELNGWFNPKQNQQAAKIAVKMARESKKNDQKGLYAMRAELVKAIDPLQSAGHELQEALLRCNSMAMGEA